MNPYQKIFILNHTTSVFFQTALKSPTVKYTRSQILKAAKSASSLQASFLYIQSESEIFAYLLAGDVKKVGNDS